MRVICRILFPLISSQELQLLILRKKIKQKLIRNYEKNNRGKRKEEQLEKGGGNIRERRGRKGEGRILYNVGGEEGDLIERVT